MKHVTRRRGRSKSGLQTRPAAWRIERDSMGEMQVPSGAYYGAQTARAIENFPISGLRFSPVLIRMLGLIKWAAAQVNEDLGLLDPSISRAVKEAAQEVAKNQLDDHFPVDIFQTGSGTSTNMNANEVIANRATELLDARRGSRLRIHPNDHVNLGQSSNDVIPTAIHLAALDGITYQLLPALHRLRKALAAKSVEFRRVLKIGRTHLQDATPLSLGQEFSGYAAQVEMGIDRIKHTVPHLGELALGGTAVGTGLNTHVEFSRRVIKTLASETGLPIREARNHFEAQSAQDAVVQTSGALKTVAVSLTKIANDIRWLGSGPRCGLGEIQLPPTQPGSSIMPGKVNPVICESLIQVAAQVLGNDLTITLGGQSGTFELCAMLPVMAQNLLQSIELLASASDNFAVRCIQGIEADEARCRALIEQSLAMCTALAPVIGYDAAASLAKEAYNTGKTVRDVALTRAVLSKSELDRLLDPLSMIGPKRNAGRRSKRT